MGFKSAVRTSPLLMGAYRALTERPRRAIALRRKTALLKELGGSHSSQSRQLAAILDDPGEISEVDREWVERIESERRRLLARHEPLIDGTLGEGGLWDHGSSIAQACSVSKPPAPALALFRLTRALGARNAIEIGTNVGISSAYIGAALAADGSAGRLATLDVSPYRQRLAKEVHRVLGLGGIEYVLGLFDDTLNDTTSRAGPFDLAFIDGNHRYLPTLDYVDRILASSTADAVFVFDDIRWSDEMRRAWSKIRSDRRFGLILDLDSVGVCARATVPPGRRLVSPRLRLF